MSRSLAAFTAALLAGAACHGDGASAVADSAAASDSATHDAMVEPVAVDGDGGASDGGGDDVADGERVGDGDSAAGAGDAGGTSAAGGGLRVIDANGALVGVLVSRGHPLQGQAGEDPLRDGVMVYHPGARLFFGVAMASGKVIVPRLGIADSDCNLPVVAGYYADGPEVAGFDYGFAYKGSWWRIVGGKPLALVGCSGIVKGGEVPVCVPHSGSCRGFVVEKAPTGLPLAFAAPLAFDWKGLGP